jgi:hypothetical protein
MHQLAQRDGLPFRVPAVVESGTRELIWDLSEYADGYTLPWRGDAPERMRPFKNAVSMFTDIGESIEGMTPRGMRRADWGDFRVEMGRLHAAAQRQGWLGTRSGTETARIIKGELDRSPARPALLKHGDFNPTNVIIPYDGGVPWVVDWDHLHYSTRGAAFARLWMFTSNEPAWQATLIEALRERLRSPDDWGSFMLFAIYEVLRQCEHQFATVRTAPRTLAELWTVSPAGARMVRMYRRSLIALLDMMGGP